MDDPAADSAIIQDIQVSEGRWRWTHQHPRIKVWADANSAWNYYVQFTIPDVILKQTGPMTIHLLVNNHQLDIRTLSREGEYQYSLPVPPAILNADDANIIGLDLDQVYVSPTDRVKLGVLVQAIGLRRANGE